MVPRPGPSDHPDLHALFAEAQTVRTAWRLRYDLPPTDPRNLDATDDLVLEDSLVLAYRRRLDLEASNAPLVMAADAARDGGALAARLQATKEALLNSPLIRAAFPRAKGPERAKSRRLHLGGKDG